MEFSLTNNRAGAGSSILLSPELVAIRAKLIDACDGKTFSDTIDFLKQLRRRRKGRAKTPGYFSCSSLCSETADN